MNEIHLNFIPRKMTEIHFKKKSPSSRFFITASTIFHMDDVMFQDANRYYFLHKGAE